MATTPMSCSHPGMPAYERVTPLSGTLASLLTALTKWIGCPGATVDSTASVATDIARSVPIGTDTVLDDLALISAASTDATLVNTPRGAALMSNEQSTTT